MSKSRDFGMLAKLAGTIGFVTIAVLVPIHHAVGVAQAETICVPPQHNDPWIGCVD